MKSFDYITACGDSITYDASEDKINAVAKKIGYENIMDELTMYRKLDKNKLDAFTVRAVVDLLIDEGWIEPTDLADEDDIKSALYDEAVEHDADYRAYKDSDNDMWLERYRV